MQATIRHSPSYAIAYCYMGVGEVLRAEAGAMVAMSGSIKVSADAGPGGVAKGLMRKALVGEGLFMTRFTSQTHGAWVALTAKFPGDIVAIDIREDQPIVAESGSLLAVEEAVDADPKWAGLQMVAMREGAVMIRLRGHGQALLAAYGGLETFDLTAGQSMVFDSGHVVAYTASMPVEVGPLSSLLTSALSREGLVARISGPGRVWVQTRSVIDLHHWLQPDKSPRH